MKQSRKIGLFILAGFILLVIGVLSAVSVIQESRRREDLKVYRLPPVLTREAFANIVDHMREDPEFGYYFRALSEEDSQRAINEVYSLLEDNQTREKLSALIDRKTEDVIAMVRLLSTMNFPDDFAEKPKAYPPLHGLIGQFYYHDFQLTILGAVYRSTFDPTFRFAWDPEARVLAARVNRLLLESGAKMPAQP